MKKNDDKKVSVEARVLAAVLAGLLIFSSIASVLIFIFAQ